MNEFRTALLIVGAVIGAGFFSGAELVAFFRAQYFLPALVFSGVLFFCACFFLLSLGKKYGGYRGFVYAGFGRGADAVFVFLSLTAFLPCAGMLAGLDGLCPSLSPLGSVVGLALVLLFLRKNWQGASSLNLLLVPFLLCVVFVSAGKGLSFFYPAAERSGFLRAALYAGMNMLQSVPLLTESGKTLKRPAAAALGGTLPVVLGALCILGRVYREGAGALNAQMPYLYASDSSVLCTVAAGAAMLTSLSVSLCSLFVFCKGLKRPGLRYAAEGFFLAAAFALSRFGIGNIVFRLYPVLGVCGLSLSVFLVFHEYFFKKNDQKIHSRREHAQNAGCRHHKIDFKHLPAVHDQITEACFRYNVFSHDRSDPAHSDRNFKSRNKRCERRR